MPKGVSFYLKTNKGYMIGLLIASCISVLLATAILVQMKRQGFNAALTVLLGSIICVCAGIIIAASVYQYHPKVTMAA